MRVGCYLGANESAPVGLLAFSDEQVVVDRFRRLGSSALSRWQPTPHQTRPHPFETRGRFVGM